MPVAATRVTERHQELDRVDDVSPLIELIEDAKGNNLKLVHYIDPYGDTTFNALQLPDVITDLRELARLAKGDAQRHVIDAVVALASRCQQDVHVYLKFVGD